MCRKPSNCVADLPPEVPADSGFTVCFTSGTVVTNALMPIISNTFVGDITPPCVKTKATLRRDEAKVTSVRTYKPVADDSSSSWLFQRNRQSSNNAGYQQIQSRGSNSQNNVINQDMSERIRRAEHAASTMRGSPTARNAAIAAALGQPNPGQWSPPDAPKSTQQRIDQNGNSYTHPGGSSVIIDNQTGKTCIVNGNQIVECH